MPILLAALRLAQANPNPKPNPNPNANPSPNPNPTPTPTPTPNPNQASGKLFSGVKQRLLEAGFREVRIDRAAYGVVATGAR